ncbi:MAG TPA: FtsX-like permease family protein [Candidatus Jorgensenbacteria bacterium]|nr:FtsX-like permease family protein [Candidatus Jorgensenbacteria bacterium]
MNNIISSLELALNAFKSNKTRTALAILGVTIGISSIIIVFSAGEGIKSLLADQVESFGADVVQAEIKIPSSKKGYAGERQSAMSLLQGAQVTTMKSDDLKDILELPNVADAYGLFMTQEQITYRGEIENTIVWATSASFIDIDQAGVDEGRFFSDAENRSLAQVIVLGSGIKEKLFGDSDPIDRTIRVRNVRFRVIGVMEERGSIMTFNFDDMIYVPVRTLQKRVVGVDYFVNILAKLHNMDFVDETMEEMRGIMRENHNINPPDEIRESIFDTGKDDFRIVSMVEALEAFDQMYSTITLVLLAIVAISLIVGGVGVMNVMYVIVNERTPEIGLRKAVGAKNNDIMLQFLVESVLITLIGGVVGTVIGILISWGVTVGATSAGFSWNFAIPIEAFVTALLFSVVFGIAFGLYPARKAALMDPIEALQHNK